MTPWGRTAQNSLIIYIVRVRAWQLLCQELRELRAAVDKQQGQPTEISSTTPDKTLKRSRLVSPVKPLETPLGYPDSESNAGIEPIEPGSAKRQLFPEEPSVHISVCWGRQTEG